jgi:hypothetical protein
MRATFPAALSGHGVRKSMSPRPRINRPSFPRTDTVPWLLDNKREECVMRHPFYMDHLGHQERRKVRHVLLRIFVVYLSLIVILAGATMVCQPARQARMQMSANRFETLGHAAPPVLTGI